MNQTGTDPYRRWRLTLFWISVPLGVVSAAVVVLLFAAWVKP